MIRREDGSLRTFEYLWFSTVSSPIGMIAVFGDGRKVDSNCAVGDLLNALGSEGWELVAAIQRGTDGLDAVTFYLKRECGRADVVPAVFQ